MDFNEWNNHFPNIKNQDLGSEYLIPAGPFLLPLWSCQAQLAQKEGGGARPLRSCSDPQVDRDLGPNHDAFPVRFVFNYGSTYDCRLSQKIQSSCTCRTETTTAGDSKSWFLCVFIKPGQRATCLSSLGQTFWEFQTIHIFMFFLSSSGKHTRIDGKTYFPTASNPNCLRTSEFPNSNWFSEQKDAKTWATLKFLCRWTAKKLGLCFEPVAMLRSSLKTPLIQQTTICLPRST